MNTQLKDALEEIFGSVSEDVDAHCGDMTENEKIGEAHPYVVGIRQDGFNQFCH